MARWRRHARPFAALLAAQIAAAASYGADPSWADKHKELSLASSDAATAMTARPLRLPIPDAGDQDLNLRCKKNDEIYEGPDKAPQCSNEGKCEDAPATSAVQYYFTECRGCFKRAPGCASGFSSDSNGYVHPAGEASAALSIIRGSRLELVIHDENDTQVTRTLTCVRDERQVFGSWMQESAAALIVATEPVRYVIVCRDTFLSCLTSVHLFAENAHTSVSGYALSVHDDSQSCSR